jgi:hypothetical protein
LHPERTASAATLHSKTALIVFALTLNKYGSNALWPKTTADLGAGAWQGQFFKPDDKSQEGRGQVQIG